MRLTPLWPDARLVPDGCQAVGAKGAQTEHTMMRGLTMGVVVVMARSNDSSHPTPQLAARPEGGRGGCLKLSCKRTKNELGDEKITVQKLAKRLDLKK